MANDVHLFSPSGPRASGGASPAPPAPRGLLPASWKCAFCFHLFWGMGFWDQTITAVWAVTLAAKEKGRWTGLGSDLGSHVLAV